MQTKPICFKCSTAIEGDPIFESPCSHDGCSSAVWHGLCLMEFRDQRETTNERFEVIGLLLRPWMQEHTENG